MNLFGNLVIFSVIPVILVLFAILPPRRAVVSSMIVSWLFLPNVGFILVGLPDYTKTSATTVGALLGACLFDLSTVARFRPRWYDIPIAVWCFSGFFTSISNDLTAYDGISTCLGAIVLWGIPYVLGRVYLSDIEGCRELAYGIVIGAAAYVPLCLWESRMSPNLYTFFYGVSRYYEPPRFGLGYRPIVFLATGLEVGVWMGAGTLCAFALWRSGAVRQIRGTRFQWYALAITLTLLMTKSIGAIMLATVGMIIIEFSRWKRLNYLLWILILTPPTYMVTRTSGMWDGKSLVTLTNTYLADRTSSIETRVTNENQIIAKALYRPILGWGGHSRAFMTDKQGKMKTVTDGYWVITLGTQGILGLAAMAMTFALPQILFFFRVPGRYWLRPEIAPVIALAIQIGLFMVDSLSNAMPNPSYALALGAITGFTVPYLGGTRTDSTKRLLEAEACKETGQLEAAEVGYVEAIRSYASAGSEISTDPDALLEVAFSYESLADLYASEPERAQEVLSCLVQAIAIHESIIADHPTRFDVYERLALDLEHLARLQGAHGQLIDAEAVWSRALEIREGLATRFSNSPELTTRWAESLNDLAWLLAFHSETAPTAAALAVKAIELESSRAGFWNTLGFANYYSGDLSTAEAAILRSMELSSGGTSFDQYLLSMICLRFERYDEALRAFEQADEWMRANAPDHVVLSHLRMQAAALLNI